MGKFNSDDHYIYYCGQESLRRNGLALIVNRVQNAVLGCNLKNNRMISVHFQGKSFNIIVIQIYASATDAEEAKVDWFYEDYWRRRWHPTPGLLPGESHGWRSLVGCSPWGREESDTTE